MPLRRADKIQLTDDYSRFVEESSGLIVFDYRGLTVGQFAQLRAKVRETGGNIRVVKNRMMKRALEGKLDEMHAHLVGPSAVVFSGEDPIAPTKAIVDFVKDNEKVEIKCGSIGETFLDTNGVEELAKVPSMPELQAKILGGIKAPASNLLGLIKGAHTKIHGLITAYAQKLEDEAA